MEQLHLLGDFNARNTVWDEHAKQKTKLGAILEDIQEPSLYILQLTLIIHIITQ